jgi:hypothetical protein
VRPPDRERVGEVEVVEELGDAVEPARVLVVVEALLHERVEVEPLRGRPARDDHERPADRERVASDDRGGAVAAELGSARPLQQRGPDGEDGQARQEGKADAAAQPEQDLQGRPVQDVVAEDVRRLVGQHDAQALVPEQVDRRAVEDDDRRLRADHGRVHDRPLGEVEVGDGVDVEDVEDLAVQGPDVRQLVGAEPHARAEVGAAQRLLVAEVDEPPHDLVEVGDLLEGGGRRAVGRVLEGARRDPVQLVGVGRKAHRAPA